MIGRAMIALAGIVMAPGAIAQTSQWRVMAEMGDASDHRLLLIDTSSLVSPAPDLRTLTVASYHTMMLQTDDGRSYNTVRITYRFDCKARTSQGILVGEYLDEVEVSSGSPTLKVEPATPGTLSGDLFEPACSGDLSKFKPIVAATPEEERERRFGKR